MHGALKYVTEEGVKNSSGQGPPDQSWLTGKGIQEELNLELCNMCTHKSNDLNLTEDDEEEGSVSSNPPP